MNLGCRGGYSIFWREFSAVGSVLVCEFGIIGRLFICEIHRGWHIGYLCIGVAKRAIYLRMWVAVRLFSVNWGKQESSVSGQRDRGEAVDQRMGSRETVWPVQRLCICEVT
jgi:hypothetical protein